MRLVLALIALGGFTPIFSEQPLDKKHAIENLRNWTHTQIWANEEIKDLIRNSSDVYTYYIILGKQMAYQELLVYLSNQEATSRQ